MSFWTAGAIVGGSLLSGYMGSQAAGNAANTQAQAGQAAAQLQYQSTQNQLAQQMQMFNINQANQQPYMQQGAGAVGALGNALGVSGNTGAAGYGSLTQPFNNAALAQTINPSYQFQLQQGMQSLQSSAAARGGLLTGQGAKDIANYSQGLASTNYQNAFQNYVTQQTNQYNRLSGIAQLGQAGAAGVGAAGVQTGANMAQTSQAGAAAQNQYLTGAAASQAAGQIGSANAWGGALTGGIGNVVGYNMYQQALGQNQGLGTVNPYATTTFGQPGNIYQGLTGNYNLTPTQ